MGEGDQDQTIELGGTGGDLSMPETSLSASAGHGGEDDGDQKCPPSLTLAQNHKEADSSPGARPGRRKEPTFVAPRP